MTRSALSAAALQPGGTIPTTCACCGVLFNARSLQAAYCGTNCRVRAYRYRRQGKPMPGLPVVATARTQPIRPAVLQPEMFDDLPLAWQVAAQQEPPASPLAPFAYQGHQVRVITDEQGEPWFVAVDVCAVLGLGNSRKALTRLDLDEKGVTSSDTLGGRQSLATVNEFGLYSLILGSRKPEARAFKRWVTHEVLPSIRRTGSYGAPTLPPQRQALPEGVHVVAATPRRAAELWWAAISGEVHSTLTRRLNPAHRTDAGLPRNVAYTWQPALL